MNRREFVRQSIQGAAAIGSVGMLRPIAAWAQQQPPVSAGKPDFAIIDTHQHLWDLAKVRVAWLKGDNPLNRSFVTKDYLEATAGLGIRKAVYMEVDVGADCLAAEAEYIVDLCRRGESPTVAAVLGGRPGEESFRPYIMRFKDSPYVKGVRQIARSSAAGRHPYAEKSFIAGIRLLGELGMRFDLCQPPAELPEAIRLVDACPDTQFILDHCGNGDPKWFGTTGKNEAAAKQWRRDIELLAKRANVVCKISGIVSSMPKGRWKSEELTPVVDHCLDAFGPDRVIFASDWPVCTLGATLREWVAALRQIVAHRSEEQQRKLFCDNAVRVYGLAEAAADGNSVGSRACSRV